MTKMPILRFRWVCQNYYFENFFQVWFYSTDQFLIQNISKLQKVKIYCWRYLQEYFLVYQAVCVIINHWRCLVEYFCKVIKRFKKFKNLNFYKFQIIGFIGYTQDKAKPTLITLIITNKHCHWIIYQSVINKH